MRKGYDRRPQELWEAINYSSIHNNIDCEGLIEWTIAWLAAYTELCQKLPEWI